MSSRAILFSAFVLAVACGGAFFFLKAAPDANATGGAFPNTKHGGGTVDSIPFSGVDRSVNPDYGTFYNNLTIEAGRYRPGECTHCHEPHASFGTTEPLPSSGSIEDPLGGPNPYLGMADANQNLCWYCHESINFNPIYGGGVGFWSFYQGKLRYQESGHYSNTTMKNPGYGAGSPWPRTNRTSNIQYGHCLNCHTPHGIKEASGTPFDTTAVPTSPTNKHLAVNNPEVSTDYLIPRQLIAWEEALCENCHKSTGEGGLADAKDIKSQIAKLEGTGSGHPLHNVNEIGAASLPFSGRHSLDNEANPTSGSWNAYSNNKRHVECVDCHNPHVAKPGPIFQSSGTLTWNTNRYWDTNGVYAGGPNKGVWGVSVNTSTGVVSERVEDTSIAAQTYSSLYLYQICLKCHSAYADSAIKSQQEYAISTLQAPSWQNRSRWDQLNKTYLGGDDNMFLTDVAKDFALDTPTPVGNAPSKGYHPVFSLGRNRPLSNANPRWSVTTYGGRPTGVLNTTGGFQNNFVPPWGPDAYVTCVDCHEDSSDTTPRGPHGSDRPFILRKLDTTITYTVLNRGDGSSEVVSYSNFKYGWVSGSSYNKIVSLGNEDPNNLCLNCHRADVYGFYGQSTGGSNCPDSHNDTENVWPRYRSLSRQPHPVDGEPGKGHSFCDPCAHSSTGYAPRGIVCMRCHGGGTVGGIHGNLGNILGHDNGVDDLADGQPYRYDTNMWRPSSNRLLNGAAWRGVRFGTTSQMGGCYKGGEGLPFNFNGCTHSGGPNEFGINATYDY